MGAQIFQIYRSHFNILGYRRVLCSKFHTKDSPIWGATIQNLVATALWHPAFVHPTSFSYLAIWLKRCSSRLEFGGAPFDSVQSQLLYRFKLFVVFLSARQTRGQYLILSHNHLFLHLCKYFMRYRQIIRRCVMCIASVFKYAKKKRGRKGLSYSFVGRPPWRMLMPLSVAMSAE